jgi:hypothetical protein
VDLSQPGPAADPHLAIDRDQTTIVAFTGGRGAFSINIGG